MTELEYGRMLRAASLIENEAIYRIGEKGRAGGPPNQLPREFAKSLHALFRKRRLTAADLANMIAVEQPRAKFLLGYLERKGLARSEYHSEGRVRIYFYGRAADDGGVQPIP